jgi:hypothetical protein
MESIFSHSCLGTIASCLALWVSKLDAVEISLHRFTTNPIYYESFPALSLAALDACQINILWQLESHLFTPPSLLRADRQ